jgi:hypothetical protein
VGRRLEHGVQVQRAVHASDRLTVGLGLLDVDLGLEPVAVDQQQHQVGPAGEPVVRHAACWAAEEQPMMPSRWSDSVA